MVLGSITTGIVCLDNIIVREVAHMHVYPCAVCRMINNIVLFIYSASERWRFIYDQQMCFNGVPESPRGVCFDNGSRGWFRSTDLWVMGPARFLISV